MTASDVQGSLKEALYETLNGILSPHYETRKAAEQRIQALEVTEEFGIHLTEFVVDPNGHLPIRQLASVLLKQYVETHWCSLAEKFRPPELNNAVKERIKELLPLGLRESISKVRTAVAYAISGIAHWDWPENWPGLFDVLVSCLREESEYAVHGAMRVLTEFSRDLTDAQLPNVGPVILQEMYRIFQSENYSIRTRGRAIEIFITITTLVAHTGAYEKGFIEQYLQPIIPMFCEKFVECLRVPNGQTSDCGFKTDIIKAINCLVTKLPKYISNLLPQMLPPVWETLCQSAKTYQEMTVNADEDINDKDVDSDASRIDWGAFVSHLSAAQTCRGAKRYEGSPPLLLGRCLCLGGRYAKIMPPEVSSRFLEATVTGLQENQPPCIRISAVKAIYWFSEASTGKDPIVNIIRCHMPNIFQGLFNLVSQPSTDVLILVMESFQTLIWQHKEFTASVENKICPLTIAVFVKFHSDPAILNICLDIFKDLTQNPSCIGPLQTRIIPTLTSMMAITPMNKSKDEGSRAVALDVLKVLVQYSPTPLSNALVETAFPTACHCILNSEDHATLQSGGELVRTYLSVAAQQVIAHRENEGQTGLQYILQIIAQLLNPQSSEFTATFVGRLVTTLIKNVGDSLGENLDLLLKAVLSKMQSAEALIVMQSLLMIYAHLINMQFDAVLNFLSTVPGPTGQSALAFVLSEWVSRQHLFLGRYDRKVATIALCKILEYGVTHGDSRLDEITVKGDMIISGIEDGVRTRSKAESQPYEWTTVPVLVKIFKVIINELLNDIEAVSASQDTEVSDDEDEEEDDDELIDPGNESANVLQFGDEDNDDEEDPELLRDSIYHLNLGQYLRDFLLNFSTHHCFRMYIQHLNVPELKVLNNININALM
ncbi:PREDICTED: importin-9 [Wasmannia auropunctata]|uniref:importin-9 n=1 Tax=Wasmannia auropunctata TaxID=64793 RepID=UPI0005EF42E5|nr:PREDICTED: importin-9 [Wasmannia auropunctata]